MGKTIAVVMGWIFVIVGILGFIPNPIIGSEGMFHADLNHNIVHLVFGILLLWSTSKGGARVSGMLKTLGIVYIVLGVLGFLMGGDSLLGIVEINGADNWLHLVLGAVLLVGGLKGKGAMVPMASSQPVSQNMGGPNMGM